MSSIQLLQPVVHGLKTSALTCTGAEFKPDHQNKCWHRFVETCHVLAFLCSGCLLKKKLVLLQHGLIKKIHSIFCHIHGWKTSQCLYGNIQFCCLKHGWKMSQSLVVNTRFCWRRHGWKLSQRLVKMSVFLPQTQLENVPITP